MWDNTEHPRQPNEFDAPLNSIDKLIIGLMVGPAFAAFAYCAWLLFA